MSMFCTFSLKRGGRCEMLSSFLLGLCYFSICWSSWTQFGLDFGRSGPPFWRFLGSILEVSGHDLGLMCFVILILFETVLGVFGIHFAGFGSRFGSHVVL